MIHQNILSVYGKGKEQILSSLPKLEMEEKGFTLMNGSQPSEFHTASYSGNWILVFNDHKELTKFYIDNDNKIIKKSLSQKLINNEMYEAKYKEASQFMINSSEDRNIFPILFDESKLRGIDMYTLANMIISKYNENKSPFFELEKIRMEFKIAVENALTSESIEQIFRTYELRIKSFIDANLSPTR